MVEAICAGIVIGLGCVANLYIGRIMGAVFYAIVVMSCFPIRSHMLKFLLKSCTLRLLVLL